MNGASTHAEQHDAADEDHSVFAVHLLRLHGYEKAIETVKNYIDEAQTKDHRDGWECIADEIRKLANKA